MQINIARSQHLLSEVRPWGETLTNEYRVVLGTLLPASRVVSGKSQTTEAEEMTFTCFPSRALWSFATVANTLAACSPPITEMRAFGQR